jgi:hypothetical protein
MHGLQHHAADDATGMPVSSAAKEKHCSAALLFAFCFQVRLLMFSSIVVHLL